MKTWIRRHRLDFLGLGIAVFLASGLLILFRWVLVPDRQQGRCIANLKQIGLGMSLYIRDYDETFSLTKNWTDAITPYSTRKTSHKAFQCPTDEYFIVGYAMHSKMPLLKRLSMVQNPQQTVYAFDSEAGGANPVDDGQLLPNPSRHTGGHSVLFHDFHVKMIEKPNFRFGYPRQTLNKKRKLSSTR